MQKTFNTETPEENLPRREREKLGHRREIIDAAVRVFANKGFSNATLEEIAQEAEFSKGALYLHFSSKEDLLYNIIMEKASSFKQFMRDLLNGKESFRKELCDLFKRNAELAFKEKDFFVILMVQHAAGFTALSAAKASELITIHDEFYEIVHNRIVKALESGELRNICPEAVTRMILSAIENMMISNWNCKTLKQLQTAVEIFIDILFNGIAKEKEIRK